MSLLDQAQSAADYTDHTVDNGGQFNNEPPAAGPTTARFVGYVEIGSRAQRAYQGQEKPPADEVRLYFELLGKKHRKEVGEGDDKRTVGRVMNLFPITIKTGDKAKFRKLFNKMAYGRSDIKHMAAMLGEGFKVTVVNTEKEVDGKKRTYSNLTDSEGNWLVGAPVAEVTTEDGEIETKPLPVPEATVPLKLLLWDNPTKEQWDSIFIDGTRTVKDKDGEREVSKNWLQEDIVENALNFEGSPLQSLLAGVADLTLDPEPEEEPAEDEQKEEPKEQAPSEDVDDILDELDL